MRPIILLISASLVTAQQPDISNIPQCVITCLTPALSSTGCSLIDLACICKSENQDKIKGQALPCLEKGCSKDDQTKAGDAINSICGAGASQSLTTRPSTSTSATTGTTTSKSSPTTTTSTGANSSGSLPATSTSISTTGGSMLPPSTSGSDSPEPSLSKTSSEAKSGRLLPTATGQSNSSGGGGLSKGAIAGIGVGAGLGGIAVITGFAWIFYVRGKQAGKKSRDVDETTEHQDNSTSNSVPPLKLPIEAGGNPIAELP